MCKGVVFANVYINVYNFFALNADDYNTFMCNIYKKTNIYLGILMFVKRKYQIVLK